jgi:hypothetical protein
MMSSSSLGLKKGVLCVLETRVFRGHVAPYVESEPRTEEAVTRVEWEFPE